MVPSIASLPTGRGLFLCLEGPDGGGKSTQAARLAEALRAAGRHVVSCRDPGGTPLGDHLRELLLRRGELEIGIRAEMLLFMASRAQLVDRVIRPALEAGRDVVSDRFLLSNIVYQGYAGGLDVGGLWGVGRSATGGLLPDLTIVVDVPPDVARARIGAPRDRIEERGDAERDRVRAGFLGAARHYPAPIAVVDGSAGVDEVASEIIREVVDALGTDPRT